MSTPLYEQIYQSLMEQIQSGGLQPGDRVPSEKELADRFEVSRITSKKALELLVQQGLVERVKGKGSFVKKTAEQRKEDGSLSGIMHGAAQDGRADARKDIHRGGTANRQGRKGGRLIGVIVPEFADSYGSVMLHAIEKRCAELGSAIVLKLTYDVREDEEKALHMLLELGVDGLIVLPVHGQNYNQELLRIVLDRFPLVLVDRYLKGIPACAVYTDNKRVAQEITEMLLRQGHRHIAFLSTPADNTSSIEDRMQGFSLAMALGGDSAGAKGYFLDTLGSSLPRRGVSEQVEADKEKIKRFIDDNSAITAIVACEYNLALIAMQALREQNVTVPGQIEIVCFDHMHHPFHPLMFTHVRQNEEKIGAVAVDRLFDMLEGREVPLHVIVEHEIVERAEAGALDQGLLL